jgi:hypothetical protein
LISSCDGSQEITAVALFLGSCPNVAFRRAWYTVCRGWGAAQLGSFEAILLIASSSTALFWLAVRMA